jgi:hypothetical protein
MVSALRTFVRVSRGALLWSQNIVERLHEEHARQLAELQQRHVEERCVQRGPTARSTDAI